MEKKAPDGSLRSEGIIDTYTEYEKIIMNTSRNTPRFSPGNLKKKLSETERNYQEIFNSTYEAILIHDAATGRILDVNDAMLATYGYNNKEDVLRGNMGDLSSNEDPFTEEKAQEIIRKAINEGTQVFDWKSKKKNGETFWTEVSVKKTEIGGQGRILAIVRDISETRLAKEELHRMVNELVMSKEKAEQSDRLKTAFLNNLSHEIRTPLNAISGFSQFLNDPGLDAARIEHITGIICRSSDQLLAIMNDIISISTIEAGIMEMNSRKTNINSILKTVHEQLQLKAATKGISLRFFSKLSETDASVLSDETKLTQVISNLVDNAIKFTRFGYVEFGCVLQEGTFMFSISDTGTGIPEKLHSVIFERFQQLDIGQSSIMSGLGLGLPIAKSYVELMGGQIWLESGPGKGTRFYFTLPRIAGEKVDIAAKPPTSGLLKRNPVILVAEDEENNFELTRVVLSMLGIEVLHARDGVEAVRMCEEYPKVDMVLMDIKMPFMNGYEATKLIKENNKHLPIVALTAYALPGDREKALNAGCNDYLPKPVSISELKKLVQKYLPKND